MARTEKTVFISYRRKDISWALAVYQYLTSQKYDVFFDFSSLSSGDFEQVIVSNIRARAHFVLILTPTALDRTAERGDWLRREIETAIDEKRNIIPLFFDGFNFGSPSVAEKLTGKLSVIPRYNGLDIPSGYFMEAMERLRARYLNVPLNAVIHPVSTEVQKVVREEQVAVEQALEKKKEVIEQLVKPSEEKQIRAEQGEHVKAADSLDADTSISRSKSKEKTRDFKLSSLQPYAIGVVIVLVFALGVFAANPLIRRAMGSEIPTQTAQAAMDDVTPTTPSTLVLPTKTITPTLAETLVPPTPTSAFSIGDTMVSPKDGMVLVYVPEGEFPMGSDAGDEDEKPVHTVFLDSIWIDQTEVTNSMYAMCVNDGQCDPPNSTRSRDRASYYGNAQFNDYPVIYASWNDATSYCSWADRRLPTEAEWEKSAGWDEKNQVKYKYPWGDDFIYSMLNFCDKSCAFNHTGTSWDDGYSDTSPAGHYPNGASPYGVLDMVGNVWEWVNDWYEASYYGSSPASNPPGPDSGQYRVIRGGSWFDDASVVQTFYRNSQEPSTSYFHFGFRCAKDASE